MTTSSIRYLGDLRTESTHTRSGNRIITDAPVDNQGRGENFSPTDLVATALANCAMTVMGIAARNHEIPFSNVEATVEKIMASEPRRISGVKINFYLNEKLDEKQRKILEHAAMTCPVAKSLNADLVQELRFFYPQEK